MSDPKQLKFQFTVDEASLQKTRQLIRELTADLIKLNSEAGKAGSLLGQGGGAGVSVGTQKSPEQQRVMQKTPAAVRPLVQGFLDGRQVFKSIADGSRDSLRATDQAVKQSVSKQKQELDSLEASVKKLRTAYKELWDAHRQVEPGTRAERESHKVVGDARDNLRDAERRLSNARWNYDVNDPRRAAELRDLEDKYGGGGGGGGGDGSGGPGFFGTPKINPKLKAGLKIGAALLATATLLGNEYQGVLSGQQGLQANRNQAMLGPMQAMRGGDLTWGMALLRAARRSGGDNAFMNPGSAIGQTTNFLGALGEGIGSGVRTGVSTLTGGLVGGGGSGRGGITLGALTPAGIRNRGIETAMAAAATEREAIKPLERMALETFSGSMGQRIAMQHLMGGRGLSIGPDGKPRDWYGDTEARLMERGLNMGDLGGGFQQLRGGAGREFASRYAEMAMHANAAGYGGFNQLLMASGRLTGGVDLARMATGGGIDMQAGINLGQAVLGTGFNPNSTAKPEGALAAIQAGMMFQGNVQDFNRVDRAKLGLDFGSRLTTGSLDQHMRASNLVSALKILGPGANIYAADKLANKYGMTEMLSMAVPGAQLDATAQGLGLKNQDFAGMIDASATTALRRYRDTGADDPISKAMRAYRESGMTPSQFLARAREGGDDEAIRGIAGALDVSMGLGSQTGLGWARIMSGLGGNPAEAEGRTPGVGLGGAEAAFQQGQADIAKQIQEELKKNAEAVAAAGTANAAAFGVMGTTGSDLEKNAKIFSTAIKEMADIVIVQTQRMRNAGAGGFNTGPR